MAETKIVNAIVLRAVNYRDFDRMLTLFTREEGKLSACARGAHRIKSPLAAASTPFCTGEYALEEKNGKYLVKSCLLDAAFYPLREDARRLSYAVAFCQICEEIVQVGESNAPLYDTLLRALTYLSFDTDHDPTQTALPFLLRAMALSGHAAMLTRCAACGGRIEDARFDPLAGGVVCARHASRPLPVITGEDMAALRSASAGAFVPSDGDAKRLCQLMGAFVRAQMERDFEALTFAEQL
jgi:DNA repair protein RecO (recombination protein O)